MTTHLHDDAPSLPAAFLGGLLWLAMLSATLFETDAYRFAGIIAAIWGLVLMLKAEPRYRMSALGWLSIGWGVYALTRFGWLYGKAHSRGSSEWLYAFPLFFPGLGMALTRLRPVVRPVLAIFFAAAAVLLAATLHVSAILAGEAAPPLFHNNQIHTAVACGLIAIGAFYWMLDALTGVRRDALARLAMVLGPVVILLALVGIFAAKSKGVWLAVVLTAPLLGLSVFFLLPRRLAAGIGLALLAVLALFVVLFRENLWATAGPTIEAVSAMLSGFHQAGDLESYLRLRIDSGDNPQAMNERLEIWYNAVELFRQAPWFGHGNRWLDLWPTTRYYDVGYTLMHNGYAEIAIRHGLFGLAVFAVMIVWFVTLVARAARAGLISRAAFLCYLMVITYFGFTLLTNSNNRLALGESLAMLAGAVAFHAETALRARRLTETTGDR